MTIITKYNIKHHGTNRELDEYLSVLSFIITRRVGRKCPNTENPLDDSQAVQWDSCMKNWDTWQLSVRVNEFSSSPAY